METDCKDGLERLRDVTRSMGSAVVTLSGGVDSALVAHVAHEVLGERAVALTATSPSLPREEAEDARRFASDLGLQHLVVDSSELASEGYAANEGDRCYHCKTELFRLAEQHRIGLGFDWVADGTLLDDLDDHRPGMVAAAEHRVRHPLVEAGLGKSLVRSIAHSLGVPSWDKPAFACLGSRFPVGTPITVDKLSRVDRIERTLRQLGFRQFRVRWHELEGGVLARIEVDPSEIVHLASDEVREQVTRVCLEAGFRWATLDLVGYRSPTNH